MDRLFLLLAGLSGFISVAAGAFGAHGLKARLRPEMLEVFKTGATYQMYHALALLAVVCLLRTSKTKCSVAAGWLFVIGSVIFSGSLYALALTGIAQLGAITPIGGACFLAGWICVAVSGWKEVKQ